MPVFRNQNREVGGFELRRDERVTFFSAALLPEGHALNGGGSEVLDQFGGLVNDCPHPVAFNAFKISIDLSKHLQGHEQSELDDVIKEQRVTGLETRFGTQGKKYSLVSRARSSVRIRFMGDAFAHLGQFRQNLVGGLV